MFSVTVSKGTEYSSPDCTSCSNGGTITVTMSCSINKDTKCDKFMKTSCDYVNMVGKVYSCAEMKKNFTYYEKEHLTSVKDCDDVCGASGSGWSSLTLTKIVLIHSFYNWEMLRYN